MSNDLVPYTLQAGYMVSKRGEGTIRTVLGSCVSVCICSGAGGYGAMNHFLYPRTADPARATPMFGNVATLALIRMVQDEGFHPSELEAQIFGGAYPPGAAGRDIGAENIAVAEKVLARKGITLVSRDVGGGRGRKIVLDVATGHVAVVKVRAIRNSDWAQEVW
ncbi:MAG: chemotaxis protein CheD [Fibrobacterota bacterium]